MFVGSTLRKRCETHIYVYWFILVTSMIINWQTRTRTIPPSLLLNLLSHEWKKYMIINLHPNDEVISLNMNPCWIQYCIQFHVIHSDHQLEHKIPPYDYVPISWWKDKKMFINVIFRNNLVISYVHHHSKIRWSATTSVIFHYSSFSLSFNKCSMFFLIIHT